MVSNFKTHSLFRGQVYHLAEIETNFSNALICLSHDLIVGDYTNKNGGFILEWKQTELKLWTEV